MKDKIKEMFGKKEEEKKECGCGPECECSCKDEDTKVEETKQEDILAKKDEEIGKLQAEVEEWKQSYLRKQAEFQNFTKRKEKEMEELRKFASEKIITKLLDGLDNLERAITASSATKDFDGLVKGVTASPMIEPSSSYAFIRSMEKKSSGIPISILSAVSSRLFLLQRVPACGAHS